MVLQKPMMLHSACFESWALQTRACVSMLFSLFLCVRFLALILKKKITLSDAKMKSEGGNKGNTVKIKMKREAWQYLLRINGFMFSAELSTDWKQVMLVEEFISSHHLGHNYIFSVADRHSGHGFVLP